MRQEISRKSIHLITNALIPFTYFLLDIPKIWMVGLLGFGAIVFIIVDLGRTRNIWIAKIFQKFFNNMMRSHELDGKLTGASYVLIGSFVTITLFPKDIAIPALLFASFGDTFAALVGKKYGKVRIWGKTLEGSIAGFIACILVTWFIPGITLEIKIIGALAAMLIELIPIRIDDNLRIPLFSGAIMLLAFGIL
jgi:dolichol kinase